MCAFLIRHSLGSAGEALPSGFAGPLGPGTRGRGPGKTGDFHPRGGRSNVGYGRDPPLYCFDESVAPPQPGLSANLVAVHSGNRYRQAHRREGRGTKTAGQTDARSPAQACLTVGVDPTKVRNRGALQRRHLHSCPELVVPVPLAARLYRNALVARRRHRRRAFAVTPQDPVQQGRVHRIRA